MLMLKQCMKHINLHEWPTIHIIEHPSTTCLDHVTITLFFKGIFIIIIHQDNKL